MRTTLGWWTGQPCKPLPLRDALVRLKCPIAVLEDGRVLDAGAVTTTPTDGAPRVVGFVPPIRPENLGDHRFRSTHGVKLACIAGAMANGISSVDVVEAMARAGMLGFFGSAGLMPDIVERAVDRLSQSLGAAPYGFNLIHSPYEPALESSIVDLYLRRGVRLVSASAYLGLTPDIVRYRLRGIARDETGRAMPTQRIIAKVSRVEVAQQFLSPAPNTMLRELVHAGKLTAEEAHLGETIPVADDLTVEADSGGHTDNQPALVLLPTMIQLRDQLTSTYAYRDPPRIGAAGGISTPHAAAAAFSMGAAYVVTGSINQGCLEAGTSDAVREMLANAEQGDMTMAPAADMFEMGVQLQVLKRGTLFPMRAQKLYDLYVQYDGLDAIPAAERTQLEDSIFGMPFAQLWEETEQFWKKRDPAQVERARHDKKHQMALAFRWYLGRSSRWAINGDVNRRADYQIWCGPAMAAFNRWTRGSSLEDWRNRKVAVVSRNLLHGAAVLLRAQTLRNQGVDVDPRSIDVQPRSIDELEDGLQ